MTGTVPLLEVVSADLAYSRGPVVVRDVSLTVGPGDAIGIAGESGSGKSTLARALLGELPAVRGTIKVNGKPWTQVRRRDPERRIAQMVYQDPYSALNPLRTPRQTVEEALKVCRNLPRSRRRAETEELLGSVGLPRRSFDVRPRRLSGGQRQRVVIARALACEPRVLIADEPTSALDVSIQAQILNLLMDLRRERDLALVLVSHDLVVLNHVTDSCLVLYRGDVVESGPTSTLLSEPTHPYTRSLVNARGSAHASIGAGPQT